MIDWIKSPDGAYSFWRVVTVVGWLAAGIVICANFHLQNVRARDSSQKAKSAERERDDLAQKLLSTQRELGLAKQEMLTVREKAEEISAKLKPRRIAPEIRSSLVAALRKGPKGDVIVRCNYLVDDPGPILRGSSEAAMFANDIVGVLQESGFNCLPVTLNILIDPNKGLFMRMVDRTRPPAHAGFLQQTFSAFGMVMPASDNLDADEAKNAVRDGKPWALPSNVIVVWVSEKPDSQ